MRTIKHTFNAVTVLLVFSVLYAGGARAAMPSEEYACQVQAEGGRQGLVLVQTDNKKMAFEVSLRSTARTLDGSLSRVLAVVECIHLPAERFRDATFQKFFESAPL